MTHDEGPRKRAFSFRDAPGAALDVLGRTIASMRRPQRTAAAGRRTLVTPTTADARTARSARRAWLGVALAVAVAVDVVAPPVRAADAPGPRPDPKAVVDAVVVPWMAADDIPGMAVGLVVDGRTVVFDYGVASRASRAPVDASTLFEIGSISKTLTSTLASDAQVRGELAWSDPVRRFLPSLAGTPFGDVPLVALATHTAGGFPLQLPDDVVDDASLLAYLRAWRPTEPVGTVRRYANAPIGMLGRVVAARIDRPYADLLDDRILRPLGMTSTFVDVPASARARYAQGHAKDGRPVRLSPAPLAAEAYGIRTTAADLIRFVAANLDALPVDPSLQRAIDATREGRFRIGPMTQALIWEEYDWPVTLPDLVDGHRPAIADGPQDVIPFASPRPARDAGWIEKTGSTNGFGAFVAFVPSERLGIVLLANRNVPIAHRLAAGHRILAALAGRRD